MPLTIVLAGALLKSSWLLGGGIVLSAAASLLAIRGQRDAFFTRSRIHRRRGLLGLDPEDVPLDTVDEVSVHPIEWLPGMGDLTVQAGTRHLHFECVPHAESRARMIVALARAARDRRDCA